MVYSLLYSTRSYMIYSIIICYIAHSIKHVLYSMVYSLLYSIIICYITLNIARAI